MSKSNTSGQGTTKMFENPILESMTRTNVYTSILVYVPCIAGLMYLGLYYYDLSLSTSLYLFVFALFFWTFAEYFLHRHMFHWFNESAWSKRFHFLVHGAHHDHPKDLDRLLMPPVPGLILASILFTFFFTIFFLAGHFNYTFPFFSGFFLGYLLYSFVHYSIHRFRAPKGFEKLWLHHTLHHYQSPEKAFGVSTMFWDKLFNTLPNYEKKSK